MDTEDHQQDADNDDENHNTEIRFASKTEIETDKAATPENNSNKVIQPKKKKWVKTAKNWSLPVLNFFTLFAFILVSLNQGSNSEKAIKQTDSSLAYTKRSLDFTQKSIDLTQKSIEISEMDMVTSNAPYMKINITKEIFEIGKQIRFNVQVRNVGKTPAINFRTLIIFGHFQDYKIGGIPDTAQRIMSPEEGFFRVVPVKENILTNEILNLINADSIPVNIKGAIEYEDVFGYTYRITFCDTYQPETNEFFVADYHYEYERTKKPD